MPEFDCGDHKDSIPSFLLRAEVLHCKKRAQKLKCLTKNRNCPPSRIRTYDLLVKSEQLYQLSYGRIKMER